MEEKATGKYGSGHTQHSKLVNEIKRMFVKDL
jgi:hypothetical protein